MGRIQWARASQFNWTFDNMGGTPLQEAVAGNWQNAVALVQADGHVTIGAPNPGGGQVYWVRGVWLGQTTFPWAGFWVDPMDGDLTNYYAGGSFSNQGEQTIITLGTPLAVGTPVQLYYIYLTGEQAAKYEPLNNYPCMRRAYRGRDDYTYDFAVDRMLDLMALLHLAGREQGRDYQPLIRFLWEAFAAREESRTPPLMHDSFERQLWDRGPHLMYRGATWGEEAFRTFQNELAGGAAGRVFHVQADLPATQDAAWFGYGLDWSLTSPPFDTMDRVSFQLQGPALSRRLHNLTKIGSGSATLVLRGDYNRREKRRYVVQAESTGDVGTATCRWSRDGGLTWEAEGLVSGDRQHPVPLEAGIEVYWEGGSGTHLVAGDYWSFWGGDPESHPRRLLATLNDAPPSDPDPWSPQHAYVHALPDRFAEMTAFAIPFSQFWRRDNIIDDGDRVETMWGAWYSASQPDDSDVTIGTREATEVLGGETFYTQRLVTWDLSPYATALGVWAGIDPNRCNSSGHTQVNFLLKPIVTGLSSLTLRVKVKDAQGSYFYQDQTVQGNTWQRVTVNLTDLALESGVLPLTHPLQAVDIGIPAAPPSNGAFYLTDLKFGEHLTFAAASRLRVLEFKMEQQGLPEHEWWLDEVALNLEAPDPYPYAPRLAISLTPYGQNPWRGPTPVHYAQPLGPYLVGATTLVQTYLQLHREAQEEFCQRYGGVKGPILPVHTRNDVENIPLCGEEDFTRFSWWSRYRNYGQCGGYWPFNSSLIDASGHCNIGTWNGTPDYTTGFRQPGNTSIKLSGSNYIQIPHNDSLMPVQDFAIEALIKPDSTSAYQGICQKGECNFSYGVYELTIGGGKIRVSLNSSGASSLSSYNNIPAGQWTYIVFTRENGIMKIFINGIQDPNTKEYSNNLNANTEPLNIGIYYNTTDRFFRGAIDFLSVHSRAMTATEIADRWQIIQGNLNGSSYPEVGHGLGQYWAFLRLAQYYFITGDAEAWAILDHWLTWINTFGAAEGSGWKLPLWFSEYGFTYGTYDPGAAASIALGCLCIFLRNGSETAQTWARRILDDLRLNRGDPEFGGYRSDYHYAWLNGLVLQAFGLAAHGAAGQAYRFPALPEDAAHFEALLSWAFAQAGDEKPNVLNADLIPFTYSEAGDLWDYAPHYLVMEQMGSLEAVVVMLGAALECGKGRGDWTWWQRLLDFIIRDNLLALGSSQIRSLTTAYEPAGLKNLVRVYYADYDRDNAQYAEARDAAAIVAWGEQALDLDCRYGSPVVLENPQIAQRLADLMLQRLATPREGVEVETWLEGVRLELGDTVAVSSDFHGLDRAEFTVSGKDVDLGGRAVRLSLHRPLVTSWPWAVEAPGSPGEAWALEQASPYDDAWDYRAYVY